MKTVTPQELAKFEKELDEKQKLKEERLVQLHVRKKAKTESKIREETEKLKREVYAEFDFDSAISTVKSQIEQYGKIAQIQHFLPRIQVRYKKKYSVKRCLKKKKFFIEIPVNIVPSEIEAHAAHFPLPENIDTLTSDELNNFKTGMETFGKVESCQQRGRYLVVFFDSKEVIDSLFPPNGTLVTSVELGGEEILLQPGMPNIRKNIQEKLWSRKRNFIRQWKATETGQPNPLKI